MNKPTEPSIEDCCNSGCIPCIFDVYEQQLKLYQKWIETGDKTVVQKNNGISQMHYTSFIVTDTKEICDSLKQIFFKRTVTDNLKKVKWEPGAHFLIKYVSENICTRAYTPVKQTMDANKDYDFCIAVKKYANGLVSNYLFNLKLGEETLWRGPYGSYAIDTIYDKITMIAQGTGIAPFISIIDRILDNEDNLTSITLLYCCHDVDCILFRKELYSYKSYWNFAYKVYVSDFSEEDELKYGEPIVKRQFKTEDLQNTKFFEKAQFLLCGSSQFMNDYKTYLLSVNISSRNIITF